MANDYEDDRTIADDEELWRRIPPVHFIYDDNLKQQRPASAAFNDDKDGDPMSVMLGSLVRKTGRSGSDVLRNFPGYALATITAGLARECSQGIVRDPLPEEPAHALVFGDKPHSTRKRFAKECRWIVRPQKA